MDEDRFQNDIPASIQADTAKASEQQ